MTFTDAKEPVLFFSGGDDSNIKKWERLQLNTFMYSQEALVIPKEELIEPKIEAVGKRKGKIPRLTYYQQHRLMMMKQKESEKNSPNKKLSRPGVVSMFYNEELDLLISGYEDSKIRVWGYNEESIIYTPDTSKAQTGDQDTAGLNNENVNSRVAGMSLKATLKEHKDAVVALTCIKRDDKHYLVH